jgi:hypothetical protein
MGPSDLEQCYLSCQIHCVYTVSQVVLRFQFTRGLRPRSCEFPQRTNGNVILSLSSSTADLS